MVRIQAFSCQFLPNVDQAIGLLGLCLSNALHEAWDFLERGTVEAKKSTSLS